MTRESLGRGAGVFGEQSWKVSNSFAYIRSVCCLFSCRNRSWDLVNKWHSMDLLAVWRRTLTHGSRFSGQSCAENRKVQGLCDEGCWVLPALLVFAFETEMLSFLCQLGLDRGGCLAASPSGCPPLQSWTSAVPSLEEES